MLNYPDSYYAATLSDSKAYPSLERDIEAHTCILGGGYAGLMTALGLIERGISDVVVLEQHRVGWGASGRNGGFVFGGYSLSPQAMVKQVGVAAARELYQLTLGAVDLIRQRVEHYQIDCELVDEGVLLANWFKDQSVLTQLAEFMREQMQVEWQYLSPQALAEKIDTPRYHGALFEPNAMHFHPLNYARGIATQISQQGGRVYEDSAVTAIDYQGAEKRVIAHRGTVKCQHLVIAGGGYLRGILPKISHSILPIATYVMATEPLGGRLQAIMNTRAAIYDTRFAFDYYRPLSDSRLLWGGRVSASTRTPRHLERQLYGDLQKVFPQLSDVKIEYVWDGWMSYARHQMAQLGQIAPGVWYGVGFGGHGVAPTTVAGEVLAQAIAENNTTYRQFEPWGLPWNGGPFGPVAAQLNYWWFQLKDWWKDRRESSGY